MSLARRIYPYFTITPLANPAHSAATYLPVVFFSRGLAFLRMLLIARLLTGERQFDFGLYRPALDLINWPVALALFGLADIAERYAVQHQSALGPWLRRQYLRLAVTTLPAAILFAALSPVIASAYWGAPLSAADQSHRILLLCLCAPIILLLAFYQHLAALLRGLRAYHAACGMELFSAILLLLLSTLAAWHMGAIALISAYAVSLLVPLTVYTFLLRASLRSPVPSPSPLSPQSSALNPSVSPQPSVLELSPPRRFAFWTFVRLLCMMTFPLVCMWSVGQLTSASTDSPQRAISDFALPFTIATQLSYIAVTTWSSVYATLAAAWSAHRVRRARVQLFRIAKFCLLTLILLAVVLLLGRGVITYFIPDYPTPIHALLPGLLAAFLWFALLTFGNIFSDLRESPHLSTIPWLAVIVFQLLLVLAARAHLIVLDRDPRQAALYAAIIALAVSALAIMPVLLCRPFRFSATGIPLFIIALLPLCFLAPAWVVDDIAPPAVLLALIFLYSTGLLMRPIDRRTLRRWRGMLRFKPADPDIRESQ